ncbi:MAG TPA: hypothetical protein VMZ22_04870 [Acidimicrobiales bacterium]|nr:hypothetical protein [Acidimicrobiales bacterium]
MKEFLLSGLRAVVAKTADEFDPALLSVFTVEAAVAEWAAIERIACAAKLRAAARADEVGLDAEQSVAQSSRITAGAARKQSRTATKLRRHKKTAAAFAKGKISTVEADAISDALDENPDVEDDLLGLAATASTTDVLSECDRVRRDALDADGGLAARQRQARHLRLWTDKLGMMRLSGAVEPILGAKLVAELSRRADRLFRAQVRAKEPVDSPEQRTADALGEILDGCDATTTAKRRGPRTVVHLLVSKDAAERGWVEPGEKCETAQGAPIPMGAVDAALLDRDTKVNEVDVDDIDVRSIRNNTRYVPARLQDALIARGICCSVPGCGRTKGLQRDHNHDYAKGGPTALGNMGWLCAHHHNLKTRGLYTLRREKGHWIWQPAQRARAPA